MPPLPLPLSYVVHKPVFLLAVSHSLQREQELRWIIHLWDVFIQIWHRDSNGDELSSTERCGQILQYNKSDSFCKQTQLTLLMGFNIYFRNLYHLQFISADKKN